MTEFHRRDDWLLVIGNVKSFEEFQAKIYITISTFMSVRPSGVGGVPLSILKFLQSYDKVSLIKVA